MLGRDTDWRQGSILSDEYAYSLGLVEALNSQQRLVVITHDCDLPHEQEPNVELIKGNIIEKENPQYTSARHPRNLHLRLTSLSGAEIYVELNYSNFLELPKNKLVEAGNLDQILKLSQEEKRTLKQWLAARYGRPAFPNAFESRLRKKLGKQNIESHVAHIIAPESKYLVGIFFDLGEDRDNELNNDQPYFLSISIVYDATEGGVTARESAEKTSTKLTDLFARAYADLTSTENIILEKCAAVADTFFTLSDLRKVDQWRLEYISLRDADTGDYLDITDSLI